MAIAIKQTPVLKDKEAARFRKIAEKGFRAQKTVDFSKQVTNAKKILEKSGVKY